MAHTPAEAENGQGLQDEKKSDRRDEAAQRILPQRAKQPALHQEADGPDEDQARGAPHQEGKLLLSVEEHDAIGAGHIKFAMGEIDHAHDAENHYQPDRDQRHIAGGIHGVDGGLPQQVHHRASTAGAKKRCRGRERPGPGGLYTHGKGAMRIAAIYQR